MAPRPIDVIISEMTATAENESKDIYELFLLDIEEIFSYPKDDILKTLIYINSKDVMQIREKLFLDCIQKLSAEGQKEFLLELIKNNSDADMSSSPSSPLPEADLIARLRRRYKAGPSLEDIYVIGMSFVENKLHKDFAKLISAPTTKRRSSNAVSSSAASFAPGNQQTTIHEGMQPTTNHANDIACSDAMPSNEHMLPPLSKGVSHSAVTTTKVVSTATAPIISTTEMSSTTTMQSASNKQQQQHRQQQLQQQQQQQVVSQDAVMKMISGYTEIMQMLNGLKKQNKEQKEAIQLLCTKVDKQHTAYSNLKLEHEQLKSTILNQKIPLDASAGGENAVNPAKPDATSRRKKQVEYPRKIDDVKKLPPATRPSTTAKIPTAAAPSPPAASIATSRGIAKPATANKNGGAFDNLLNSLGYTPIPRHNMQNMNNQKNHHFANKFHNQRGSSNRGDISNNIPTKDTLLQNPLSLAASEEKGTKPAKPFPIFGTKTQTKHSFIPPNSCWGGWRFREKW